MFPHRTVLCAVFVMCAPWQRTWADPFVYTTIDVGPQPYKTVLTSVNDAGQIIGNYRDGSSFVSFLFDHGSVSTLTFPVPDGVAVGINNAGQMIGNYSPGHAGLSSEGFIFSQGALITINAPSSSSIYYPQEPATSVSGINNLGQVVGTYATGIQISGFLYNNGTYSTIAVPGAPFTIALGINDQGEIVGRADQRSFLDANGMFTTISVPGSIFTEADAINDAGQIVGRCIIGGVQHGFVYDQGRYYVLGIGITDGADGINNLGQFVGYYDNPVYVTHGFISSIESMPEPNTVALLGSGLLSLTLFLRLNKARGHRGPITAFAALLIRVRRGLSLQG
jgi:uncharacterized membrane protein